MLHKKTRSISISSGKGGVGKSSLLANLGLQLSRRGQKVLILDADMGMANIDILFAQRSRKNVLDLLQDQNSIDDVLQRLAQNLYLISGGSALTELYQLSLHEKKSILHQLEELDGLFDYLLIDTASGVDENVRLFSSSASEIFVVLTPEPASLTDAYAFIKVMHQVHREKEFRILCNQVRNERDAISLYERLQRVAEQFLNVQLNYVGYVEKDTAFAQATRNQELVLNFAPDSPSAQQIRNLADKMSSYGRLADWKLSMQQMMQVSSVDL